LIKIENLVTHNHDFDVNLIAGEMATEILMQQIITALMMSFIVKFNRSGLCKLYCLNVTYQCCHWWLQSV